MIGTVERQVIPGETPVNIPVTLAGGERGIVNKVGYNCSIDYQVPLTNGGVGVGYVGVSTVCPITYNPACCVGEDDQGNPIIKGVLRVNCIIADDLEGADCACYVYQNEISDNLDVPIALWSTSCTQCPYYPMGVSGRYQLSYNPIDGLIKTQCGCFFNRAYVGDATTHALVISSTGINAGGTYAPITITAHPTGITSGRCLSIGSTDIYSGMNFFTNCMIGVSCANYLCFDNACGYAYFSCPVCANCGVLTTLICNNDCTRDLSIEGLGAVVLCGQDCVRMCTVGDAYFEVTGSSANLEAYSLDFEVCNQFCLSQNNGDSCSCIAMTCSGTVSIFGCGGVIIDGRGGGNCLYCDTFIYGTLRACDEGMDVCDVRFCEGGWIYCNGASALYCLTLCNPEISGTASWSGCCAVPTASCIRCYLYSRCAVTAYSSGTTLFIRTQACANWI